MQDADRARLHNAFRPLVWRTRLVYWLRRLEQAIWHAALALASIVGISFVVPIESRVSAALLAGLLVMLLWLFASVFQVPGLWDAARSGDDAGLAERLVTALEFQEDTRSLYVIQREDALLRLKNMNVLEAVPYVPCKKRASRTLAMLALAAAMLVMPYRFEPEIAHRQAVREKIDKQAELVKLERETLEQMKEAGDEVSEHVLRQIKELEKQLAAARTEEQALAAISRAESEIERFSQSTRNAELQRALGRMTESLQQLSRARSVASRMSRQEWEAAARELESLAQSLGQMDHSERTALADALQAALEGSFESAEAAQLQDATQSARSAARIGDLDALQAALSQMASGVQQAGSTLESAAQAARLSSTLASARFGLLSPGEAQAATRGAESAAGGTSTGGQSQSSSSTGATGGSSGAGHGSTDVASPPGASAPGSAAESGSAPPVRREAEYEQIYAPERIGQDAPPSTVGGDAGEGPRDIIDTGPQPFGDWATRPYNEVFGEFQREARESLERSEIPPGMREYVRKYFSLLEPSGGQ